MFENDWSKVGVIIIGYVLGLYFQRRDIDAISKRFDDLYRYLDARFKPIEEDIRELKKDVKELLKVKH